MWLKDREALITCFLCWSPVIHQCGVFIPSFSFLLEALFPVFQSQHVIMPSDYNAESLPAVWNQNTGKNTKWRKGEGNRGVERKGKERNYRRKKRLKKSVKKGEKEKDSIKGKLWRKNVMNKLKRNWPPNTFHDVFGHYLISFQHCWWCNNIATLLL